jgi:hypothetical protein
LLSLDVLIITILMGGKWCGGFCISLMVSEVYQLFRYLLARFMSSLEKYLTMSFCHFLNWCMYFSAIDL